MIVGGSITTPKRVLGRTLNCSRNVSPGEDVVMRKALIWNEVDERFVKKSLFALMKPESDLTLSLRMKARCLRSEDLKVEKEQLEQICHIREVAIRHV